MTDRSRLVLAIAERRARDVQSEAIMPEHLLFALAAEGIGLASKVLQVLGGQSEFVQNALSAGRIASLEQRTNQLQWDEKTKKIVAESAAETVRMQHFYIGTEHLILGLAVVNPESFERIGINPNEVRSEVYSILGHDL